MTTVNFDHEIFHGLNIEYEVEKYLKNIGKYYQLNEQQRRVCDTLKMPYILWSFYGYKVDVLRSFDASIYEAYFREMVDVKVPNEHKVYLHDFSEYKDFNLSSEEKMFILIHKDLISSLRWHLDEKEC